MLLVEKFESKHGFIDIFSNSTRSYLYVKPHDCIVPSLVIEDILFAQHFGLSAQANWNYIVDTTNVLIANPLNIFYLRQIKTFPNLKQYIVFAPNSIPRLMLKSTSFIIKPDLILTHYNTLALNYLYPK